MFYLGLRSDAEQTVNELTLPNHIAPRYPTNLTFSDRVHVFVTVDRPLGSFRRPEP